MGLAGDVLPIATPPQPGIGYMIPGAQILAKDRLLLVSIVTKNCDVIVNPTLHLFDLDRTGISRWHRRDIRNELRLVDGASFFISINVIVCEIFLLSSLISRNHVVLQLLGSPDQFGFVIV